MKTTDVAEREADGIDNDADGSVDEGLGATGSEDQKRVGVRSLYQGDGASAVNVVSGALSVHQRDATVQGPFSAMVFARHYNSRRNANSNGLAKGWTHSFAVHLDQQPSGDDRWRVQTPEGEHQFFRCQAFGDEMGCAIDDHHVRGNLLRTGGVFYWHPGDGTVWRFNNTDHATYGRAWDLHEDGSGNDLATATVENGKIKKVISANASIYFTLVYDATTGMLDKLRVNSESAQDIVDYTVDSNGRLASVSYASSVGSIDSNVGYTFTYDATSENLTKIQQKLGSTLIATGSFAYDASDRVTSIEDQTKDLSIAYTAADPPSTPAKTTVTFDASAGSTSTELTHWGLWVVGASSDIRMGGIAAPTVVLDEHGRTVCIETDDSRVYKLTYADGRAPVKVDEYGKTGSCTSGLGTVAHETWLSHEYTGEESWRPKWVRTKSVYSPATSCSGTTLPSGCRETKYEYVSATDDRVQWTTRSGSTKNVAGTVSQQVRKQRVFYFGLDTGVCTSGDSYAGLPCRVEVQDSGGTVFARTDYTYQSSGATAGLLKAIKRSKSSGATLNTSFANHNAFGSPVNVTDERGMITDYTFNGWDGVTSTKENDAVKDDAGALLDPLTSYSYTNLRTLDTVTLPKGNRIIYKYFDDDAGFARLQAFARADGSSNLTEILRYENDKFGRRTERKVLDSINGTTPCADEDSSCTPDLREKSEYDAVGRLKKSYLYTDDASDPADGSETRTYVNGKLDKVTDHLGVETTYE